MIKQSNMVVTPSRWVKSLRYLLVVELFDHRLESLLRLSAAPAKTTETERDEEVKEMITKKTEIQGEVVVIEF